MHTTRALTFFLAATALGAGSPAAAAEGQAAPASSLRGQVDALSEEKADPTHQDAIRVLRQMADMVRRLPGDRAKLNQAARDIDRETTAIDRSSRQALHSPETKRALGAVLTAVAAVPDQARVAEPLAGARQAVAAIAVDVPYLEQRIVIEGAFQEVADALVAAQGKAPAVASAGQVAEREQGAAVPVEERQPVAGQLSEPEALGGPGGAAELEAQAEEIPAVPLETQVVRLDRYVFDQAGEQPNIEEVCGGAAAESVKMKRTAGDIFTGILTLGWYTPVHARVSCGAGAAP